MNNTIEIEAEATSIPAFLVLDLTEMPAGTSKTAGDVVLPAGTTLVSDPALVVVHLSERSSAAEPVAEAAPAAAAPAEAPKAE